MFKIKRIYNYFVNNWLILLSSFITIYIYVKSPFNQKLIFPDLSGAEYSFIRISFITYLTWGVLFFTFLYLLKKKHKNSIYPFLLWNIGFLFLSSTYNLGFDITDEGWQIAKSWGILHGNLNDNADLIWGSSFINGLWLSISGTPLLLWSRLGYLIFLPFIPVLNYLLFSKYFPKKTVFFITLISFLFFHRYFAIYSVMNYYYLPVVTSLISLWLLSLYHTGKDNSKYLLILSGIFAGISIHLKFTYVLILFFYAIYLYVFTDNQNKLKDAGYYYLSIFTTILAGFLLLFLINGASDLLYKHNRL
ncbi:MAG: hypothetical protein GQ534_09855 [Candidatus Delongbacteria bacterium]|nr:hypothetical protein [Candidatus Delongbacteria bacterium]